MLRTLTAAAVAAILVLAGCSQPSPEVSITHIAGSRVKEYTSIAELRAESEFIGVVTPTSSTIEVKDGMEYTITTASVNRVILLGGVLGAQAKPITVTIRTLGGPDVIAEDVPALAKGTAYLIFAQLYRWQTGPDGSGQLAIVGSSAGAFRTDGAGRFAKLSKDDPSLPTVIDEPPAIG